MARVTQKQRRVAKLIVENATLDKPLTGGEIVEKSGYGETMKLYPGRVIETEGVDQALNDLGFTEENAKMVVTEIMLDREKDANARLKATDQVFKVRGSYAAEKSVAVNVNVATRSEDKSEIEALREEYENKLKAKLIE